MGRETNTDLIKVLEKQIEEGKGNAIKLKRDRNSLLNISKIAIPEILGYIFVWCLVQEANPPYCCGFDGLPDYSHNFVLVCRHWFEVASRTPEVWSFWGNTLQDWKKCHHRSRATPLDLVLNGDECDPGVHFDKSLQYAVKSRAVQDTIRQVHLRSKNGDTLSSIISALTPDDEGCQGGNIESIIWLNRGTTLVDASNFFARTHLSKLRCLNVSGGFWISSWEGLVSRTTLLTTLSLGVDGSPTTSQLFSLLTLNPNLQDLHLDIVLPEDIDRSTSRVSLRDLKFLNLTGNLRPLCGLLRRLILPELDQMGLALSDPTSEGISQILGPYMQDYFRRNSRFQGRLEISPSYTHYYSTTVTVANLCPQTTAPMTPSVSLTALLIGVPPATFEQLSINLFMLMPRERIVSIDSGLDIKLPEEVFFTMPNVEALYISGGELFEGFLQPNPEGPHAYAVRFVQKLTIAKKACFTPNFHKFIGDGRQ